MIKPSARSYTSAWQWQCKKKKRRKEKKKWNEDPVNRTRTDSCWACFVCVCVYVYVYVYVREKLHDISILRSSPTYHQSLAINSLIVVTWRGKLCKWLMSSRLFIGFIFSFNEYTSKHETRGSHISLAHVWKFFSHLMEIKRRAKSI